MSVRGIVELQCPKGCEEFEAEVWSMLNFEKSPELRDRLISGEINLLACPSCGQLFHCQEMVVVLDAASELMAFVFPESYGAEAARWKAKMESDCLQLRKAMGEDALDYDPLLCFGMENFRALLENELAEGDEVDVARFLMRSLGLEPYAIRPSVARALQIPRLLPSAPGKGARHERIVVGLEKLLKENPLLGSYEHCLAKLRAQPDLALPPAKSRPKKT